MITKGHKKKRNENKDIWNIIEGIIDDRVNKGTLRVTWTKGHATQEHIDKGILTEEEKRRNEEADWYADRGREEHTRNDVNTKGAQQRTQIAMLMQTMMLKVWARRLELINEEEQRIANEDNEHYELEQGSANLAELEALFLDAAAEE